MDNNTNPVDDSITTELMNEKQRNQELQIALDQEKQKNKKLEETIIQMKTNYSRWHQITEMEEEMYVNKVCEFMVEVIS